MKAFEVLFKVISSASGRKKVEFQVFRNHVLIPATAILMLQAVPVDCTSSFLLVVWVKMVTHAITANGAARSRQPINKRGRKEARGPRGSRFVVGHSTRIKL